MECEEGDELYAGDPIPSTSERTEKRSKGGKVAIAMLKGVATLASFGLGGIYFGVMAAKRRRERQAILAKCPYESFTCANCQTQQFYSKDELRYKCG